MAGLSHWPDGQCSGSHKLMYQTCFRADQTIDIDDNECKNGGKDQESIQSSTTVPDPGYHMGK